MNTEQGVQMNTWLSIPLILSLVCFSIQSAGAEIAARPGQYVVKLKSKADMQIWQNRGSKVISQRLRLALVHKPLVQTRASALKDLSSLQEVEYAEPNFLYTPMSDTPTDPEWPGLWGLHNTGQATSGDQGEIVGVAGVDIQALQAWNLETGSRDVVVAVIDTGVDFRNPDLAKNIFTNALEANGRPGVDDDGNGWVDDIHGYDFVDQDGDPTDEYGHGTHVAGTIGAVPDNALGIVGVNWEVSILPIRFIDEAGLGDEVTAIQAVEYATQMGAKVMNNSWGGMANSRALKEAIQLASESGALFVVSAGNLGKDNDQFATYPANYDLENIVSVAAIDPRGELAKFSNFGVKRVHVAAPGVHILSWGGRNLRSWSGTSMAAPHVSGIAALMLARQPELTPVQLKERLVRTSRPLPSLKGRIVSEGIVSAAKALGTQQAQVPR